MAALLPQLVLSFLLVAAACFALLRLLPLSFVEDDDGTVQAAVV